MTAKTPRRQSLLDVAEMAHETFDGGHPERVGTILNKHLDQNNPATDFVIAMWTFTANLLDGIGGASRAAFIHRMRSAAMTLPEDGATIDELNATVGLKYETEDNS